jgi:hypothetical protein
VVDSGPHPVYRERRVTGVLENLQHEVAGARVEVRRHLPVEVLGDPITHVSLDQALEPVARRGALVKRLQRRNERLHRDLG